MNSSNDPDREAHWREVAELYELGLLNADEIKQFEKAVAGGDTVAIAARDAARLLGSAISFAATEMPAPHAAKANVISAIHAVDLNNTTQVWKAWRNESGAAENRIVDSNDNNWEETGVRGIFVRKLHADADGKMVSMLVKMEPGAAYPPHRHGALEECYVVQGDLHFDANVMKAGDYQYSGTGSVHPIQWTENGCILFIRSSTFDELLAHHS